MAVQHGGPDQLKRSKIVFLLLGSQFSKCRGKQKGKDTEAAEENHDWFRQQDNTRGEPGKLC